MSAAMLILLFKNFKSQACDNTYSYKFYTNIQYDGLATLILLLFSPIGPIYLVVFLVGILGRRAT